MKRLTMSNQRTIEQKLKAYSLSANLQVYKILFVQSTNTYFHLLNSHDVYFVTKAVPKIVSKLLYNNLLM